VRDAERNATLGLKVAPTELAEPFFVPIVPLAAQFVPNAASSWAAETRLALRPPLPDHGRARVEMSREKSRDFPTNRPELSAIKSVDCSDVVQSARDLQNHGICKTNANEMRHNCRRFEDLHDLEPGPRRPYYDQSMLPFPRFKRHMS
jgi:hypothetical protein